MGRAIKRGGACLSIYSLLFFLGSMPQTYSQVAAFK